MRRHFNRHLKKPKYLLIIVISKIDFELCCVIYISASCLFRKNVKVWFSFQMQSHEPDLWLHFMTHEIQPLRLVFRWMMRGFSGHLPPEQLLYLWDLVIAYDSMEVRRGGVFGYYLLGVRKTRAEIKIALLIFETRLSCFNEQCGVFGSSFVLPLTNHCTYF